MVHHSQNCESAARLNQPLRDQLVADDNPQGQPEAIDKAAHQQACRIDKAGQDQPAEQDKKEYDQEKKDGIQAGRKAPRLFSIKPMPYPGLGVQYAVKRYCQGGQGDEKGQSGERKPPTAVVISGKSHMGDKNRREERCLQPIRLPAQQGTGCFRPVEKIGGQTLRHKQHAE